MYVAESRTSRPKVNFFNKRGEMIGECGLLKVGCSYQKSTFYQREEMIVECVAESRVS